ncbi:hypothetical protein BDR03DRAFT_933774 [Suillus americanus]|nr:hypothetical protein BDR03DRAFT_933774 [Suillus americanus]
MFSTSLLSAKELAGHLEVQLGIDRQWEIGSKHYYRSALDELKRLVVMCLFELSKLLLSGTGYKLRQQITKALQCCSDAIQNAINRYNTQAAALVPPRPKLAWKDIVEYSFLGEFDLLYADWTAPAHQIQCLDIEIRRLRMAIHDEKIKTNTTIEQLLVTNPLLAVELRRRWQACTTINAIHLYWLNQIESQLGFLGRRGIGV